METLKIEQVELIILIGAIVAIIARRLKIPYTVGLVLADGLKRLKAPNSNIAWKAAVDFGFVALFVLSFPFFRTFLVDFIKSTCQGFDERLEVNWVVILPEFEGKLALSLS